MITKPEDAVPESLYNGKTPILYFTAKECAEIARAYASALHASEFNSADAAINVAKWDAKFKEWET